MKLRKGEILVVDMGDVVDRETLDAFVKSIRKAAGGKLKNRVLVLANVKSVSVITP